MRWRRVAGFTVFVGGAIPVAMIDGYYAGARLLYPPLVGVAIIAAVAIHGAGIGVAGPARRRTVGRARGTARVGESVRLMLIGGQMAYRLRHRYDVRQGEMLRALVPHPPEGAVFIPASIAIHPKWRRQALHYQYLAPVWSAPWASPKLREASVPEARPDSGLARRMGCARGRGERGRSSVRRGAFSPLYAREPGGTRVPWRKAVLFEIEGSGDLALITAVRVTGDGGGEYVLPLAAGAARAPTRVLELPARVKVSWLESRGASRAQGAVSGSTGCSPSSSTSSGGWTTWERSSRHTVP